MFDDIKIITIVILLILLVFVTLGVNLLGDVANKIEYVLIIIYNFIRSIVISIGYNTGEIVNASSNTATNAAKIGIDITNGAINDIGNLLKGQSIDVVLHSSKSSPSNPQPNNPHESSWCFVNKGYCIDIDKDDKCESGKIFSSQAKCLSS